MQPQQSVVLFDGVCNLCHGFVRFIIERDVGRRFVFASLQSNEGRALLVARGRSTASSDAGESVVLIEAEEVYERSGAVLLIARGLGWPWSLAAMLLAVPRLVRDVVYCFVARNRYRWFGKRAECLVLTPELSARFLGNLVGPGASPASPPILGPAAPKA
jgi:predicted DCC family thiol-disulfide oxidoreductase YuxK